MGPFDSWPSGGGGFEYFYGFIGGETNQYYPAIYEGTIPVEPEKTPEEGYHFTQDMTDKAIKWIGQQQALMPDKPFFVYFAPGATHAPHHVPEEWSAKYQGSSTRAGTLREETLARQRLEWSRRTPSSRPPRGDSGLGRDSGRPQARPRPADGDLRGLHGAHGPPRRPPDRRARRLGVLEDTLVYYIIGDNGASAEGTLHGCFNELVVLNGAAGLETTEFMVSRIDDFGTPAAYNHYAVGWAHAMDTPYQWTKQIASHWAAPATGRSCTGRKESMPRARFARSSTT